MIFVRLSANHIGINMWHVRDLMGGGHLKKKIAAATAAATFVICHSLLMNVSVVLDFHINHIQFAVSNWGFKIHALKCCCFFLSLFHADLVLVKWELCISITVYCSKLKIGGIPQQLIRIYVSSLPTGNSYKMHVYHTFVRKWNRNSKLTMTRTTEFYFALILWTP